jgi:hypothetical protein
MLRGFLLFAAFVAALAAPAHRAGAADEAYSVAGVAVDATAADALQARASALAQGQRAAWRILLERLVAADQTGALAELGDERLGPLVRSFEVEQEKVAPDRYIATLTYHFDAEAVRTLLASAAVSFVEGSRTPLVVLPVLDSGTARLLFEEGNGWAVAWGAVAAEPGLVPVVVPFGDLEDVATIDGTRAAALDGPAIDALAARYQATGAAVTVAAPRPAGEDGSKSLEIALTVLQGDRRDSSTRSVSVPLEADDAELFVAGARAVRAAIDAAWKGPNLLVQGAARTVAVNVPVAGLADWVEVRRRLAGVGAIRRVDVTALGARLVSATLTVAGDDAQLARALATQRLTLARDADILVLRRSDSASSVP